MRRRITVWGLAVMFGLGPSARSVAQEPELADDRPWTVMIYGGVDSSAEAYLMPHLGVLRDASRWGQEGEVVLLIDRVAGASKDKKILGENFEDTRLFRLDFGRWERIAGGADFPEITRDSTHEADTGDPRTLRKFIRFAKGRFPAKRYALILFGHGEARSLCPDISSECADSGEFEDPLFTAEISEGLTVEESVDVLWVDVCSFAGIENAYQFRPAPDRFHAQVMLTTATLSAPAPMTSVLRACGIVGADQHRAPLATSAAEFGAAAIKVIGERLRAQEPGWKRAEQESWGCFDLTRAQAVKHAVDRLAVALHDTDAKTLAREIRGTESPAAALNYLYTGDPLRWILSPHYDLYDLARRFRDDPRLSSSVREAAAAVAREVDGMVIDSFGMSGFAGFEPGRHGLFIVFPGGVEELGGSPIWEFFRWYHPSDQRTLRTAFGNYAWCRDGATPADHRVENWFELMDAWFDVPNEAGGVNAYRW